ncbi:MAG: AAA family ATPase [Bacteroides sp.]|nr:AAA family ATPase [Bacteroides sp.]
METTSIRVKLGDLLLDPNNYRFIDRSDYTPVSAEHIADERVQKRTLDFLRGKSYENIEDLINSFKTNGILKQDPIQAKRTSNGQLVVIEGNRRTAALKTLQDRNARNLDIGILQPEDFDNIEIIEIQPSSSGSDRKQELIAMGLNHIGGKKRWSPLNQAQLVYDLLHQCDMKEDDVCASLGISKQLLKRSQRTLGLISRYKQSDFGDQFTTTMYSIFEEIMKTPDIKGWLKWNDAEMSCGNAVNEEKLFSWISRIEDSETSDDFDSEMRILSEPIITKSTDIRNLAKFINDKKAIAEMEAKRDLVNAFANSTAVGKNEVKSALQNLEIDLKKLKKSSDYIELKQVAKLNECKELLRSLAPDNGSIPRLNPTNIHNIDEGVFNGFDVLDIGDYRCLSNIELDRLSRINLFVGQNNSGKTSMLEAVYILSQLNDLSSFIELERLRGKFYDHFDPRWVSRIFNSDIYLHGRYAAGNNTNVANVAIIKDDSDSVQNRTGYLTTLRCEAIGTENSHEDAVLYDYNSELRLYSYKWPEFIYSKMVHLCSASFTSPYRNNDELLKIAHRMAVQNGYIQDILNFIRREMDSQIMDIQLVDMGAESRFFVTSTRHDRGIDLTKYGEGMQRVFEIALLIGLCQNGILCVDEVDSAIHTALLKPFALFLDSLAERFNVQLYISTHSKECIDAFSAVPDNRLMAYHLFRDENGKVDYKFIEGKRLRELVASINIDIR